MSQFELTGEKIAPEIDLERYGDPEKARMRAALEAIRDITGQTFDDKARTYTALSQIDQLARQGLAP